MDEPEQLALLDVKPQIGSRRPVEYVAPSPEVINEYVQSVCRRLAQRKDADYKDTDFVRGLTNFMQVVVSIQMKYRNKGVQNVQ